MICRIVLCEVRTFCVWSLCSNHKNSDSIPIGMIKKGKDQDEAMAGSVICLLKSGGITKKIKTNKYEQTV